MQFNSAYRSCAEDRRQGCPSFETVRRAFRPTCFELILATTSGIAATMTASTDAWAENRPQPIIVLASAIFKLPISRSAWDWLEPYKVCSTFFLNCPRYRNDEWRRLDVTSHAPRVYNNRHTVTNPHANARMPHLNHFVVGVNAFV